MTGFDHFGQVSAAGLTNGAIFALIALGFSLVFSVNGFLNLAQGEFVTLSGLSTVVMTATYHIALPVAAVVAIVLSMLLGALFERLALSPGRRISADTALIVTLGGAFFFHGADMVIFGKDALSLPAFSGEAPILLGGIAISTQSLWIAGTLIIATAALWCFFRFTFVGKAMLACAQSPTGARLVGIDLAQISTLTYAASSGLGALAGVVVAPLTFVSANGGLAFGIEGFIAALLGGIGSFTGAVLGGLILGLGQAFAAGYLSSQFKEALTFAALLIVLLIRPSGLFAGRR